MSEVDTDFIEATYTNWRGETAVRRLRLGEVRFGTTEWHPEPTWLISAFDLDHPAKIWKEYDLSKMDFTRTIAALPPAVPQDACWIVGNVNNEFWRTWEDGFPRWTADKDKATRYARRKDAEDVHQEDDEAWRVVPYVTTPDPVAEADIDKAVLVLLGKEREHDPGVDYVASRTMKKSEWRGRMKAALRALTKDGEAG